MNARQKRTTRIAIVLCTICHSHITTRQYVDARTVSVSIRCDWRFNGQEMKASNAIVHMDVMLFDMKWVFHRRQYLIEHRFWRKIIYCIKTQQFYMFTIKVAITGAKTSKSSSVLRNLYVSKYFSIELFNDFLHSINWERITKFNKNDYDNSHSSKYGRHTRIMHGVQCFFYNRNYLLSIDSTDLQLRKRWETESNISANRTAVQMHQSEKTKGGHFRQQRS